MVDTNLSVRDILMKCYLLRYVYRGIKWFQRNILWIMPKGVAHRLFYYKKMGKRLNLKNPRDLNEKIQWLMVNCYGESESYYADKYLVRNYVKEKGYGSYLPKLYNVYDNIQEVDIEQLPDKFVLKANHGSGSKYYSICYDKKIYNGEKEIKKLAKSMKSNYAKKSLEYHYAYIKPKIICEEYLEDMTGTQPLDYKIFCFMGEPECILVCSDRRNGLKRDYYDKNWHFLEYTKKEYRSEHRHEKPKNLEMMLKIAKDLSQPFPFVRVDLYNINGQIYFGELTLTPAAGTNKTYNQETLDYLGDLLDLNYKCV